MSATNEKQMYPAEPTTELDHFWLDVVRTEIRESTGAIEGAAKQLISIVTILQGIYFAAISFSTVQQTLIAQRPQEWLLAILFVLPIALWLGSLVFAINVFTPKLYKSSLNSPGIAHNTYYAIVGYKHTQLRRAHLCLVGGFVPLLISVGVYLTLM